MWEWISLVTWVIQEIGLSRNTTLSVTPIPEEWFFQPPSSFSFFIFLNLHSLIPLEHHCYHLHFPSKHIQTLNQIPYIQPSINLSLSLSFNKFHKKKKEKPLKIHLQPLCKWVYIILVIRALVQGFFKSAWVEISW